MHQILAPNAVFNIYLEVFEGANIKCWLIVISFNKYTNKIFLVANCPADCVQLYKVGNIERFAFLDMINHFPHQGTSPLTSSPYLANPVQRRRPLSSQFCAALCSEARAWAWQSKKKVNVKSDDKIIHILK